MTDFEGTVAFIAVVEEGSFNGAARRLGAPTSSITRRVQRLESTLETTLLQRTTRSVRPTSEGLMYLNRTRPAVLALEEATSIVKSDSNQAKGTVRLTAPADFSQTLLAGILARFHQRYPKIHVELEMSQQKIDLIDEGFDLAIRGGKLTDSSLIVRHIIPMSTRLYASTKYLQEHSAPILTSDLSHHSCVLFQAKSHHSRWTLSNLQTQQSEIVDVSGPISANTYGMVYEFMREGIGIAAVPSLWGGRDHRAQKIQRVLPDWEIKGRGLSLVYPPRNPMPKRIEVLRDYLSQELIPETLF